MDRYTYRAKDIVKSISSKTVKINKSILQSYPKVSHLIWNSSVYKFVVEHGFDENDEKIYKEIGIDVTDSGPSFNSPLETLSEVLNKVLGELSILYLSFKKWRLNDINES